MVAMVEVDLTSTKCNPGDNTCQAVAVPPYILILFSVVTTVLISVYLFALMVATSILPNLQVCLGMLFLVITSDFMFLV